VPDIRRSPSASLNISHVWVQRVEVDIQCRGKDQRACGNGAFYAQHGSGVEGRLTTTDVLIIFSMSCKYVSCAVSIFLFCGLKINHQRRLFSPLQICLTSNRSIFLPESDISTSKVTLLLSTVHVL
jgi:hypothetical protein